VPEPPDAVTIILGAGTVIALVGAFAYWVKKR